MIKLRVQEKRSSFSIQSAGMSILELPNVTFFKFHGTFSPEQYLLVLKHFFSFFVSLIINLICFNNTSLCCLHKFFNSNYSTLNALQGHKDSVKFLF